MYPCQLKKSTSRLKSVSLKSSQCAKVSRVHLKYVHEQCIIYRVRQMTLNRPQSDGLAYLHLTSFGLAVSSQKLSAEFQYCPGWKKSAELVESFSLDIRYNKVSSFMRYPCKVMPWLSSSRLSFNPSTPDWWLISMWSLYMESEKDFFSTNVLVINVLIFCSMCVFCGFNNQMLISYQCIKMVLQYKYLT